MGQYNMDSIKNFFQQSTTSKVTQRIKLLNELIDFLSEKPEIPDGAVQVCIASLSQTLRLYNDLASRRKCVFAVKLLLVNYQSLCLPGFTKTLETVAKFQIANKSPNRSESARALVALTWSCTVAETCYVNEREDKSNWKSFVEMQAALFYGAQTYQCKPIGNSARRHMTSLWKKLPNSFQVYADVLLASDASITNCVLMSALAGYDKPQFISKKHEILNLYVKSVIMSKVPVNPSALECCVQLVVELDHLDFETSICPALQKALLRSPENALPIMKSIVCNVGIDLSRHSMTIAKMLTPQIISKNDANAEIASGILVAMATQCSDADAVGETVRFLFSVLKGSEGKLSIPGQKLAVLNAIGGLGDSAIGSGQSAIVLVKSVVVLFQPFLQQEIHDLSLVAAVSALSKWCKRLRSEIPDQLLDWFVKAPPLKSSTPLVRCAYINCMYLMFNTDNIHMVEPLIAYLMACVEKASQHQSHIPLVSEALYASCIITRLENIEFKKSYKFLGFWNIILDSKKPIFTTDKFLQNASEGALLQLDILISQLLLDRSQRMQADVSRGFYKSLVYILLNKPWPLQEAVRKTIRKLLASYAGPQHCKALLAELRLVFESSSFDFENLDDDYVEVLKMSRKYVSALRCFVDVPSFKTDKDSAKSVALLMLIDTHQPCITCTNANLFMDFFIKYDLHVHNFIEENLTTIKEMLIKTDVHTKASLTALTVIVKMAPDIIMPVVSQYVLDVFTNSDLTQTTKREFEIMNTPPGELWNISIIDRAPKIAESKKMKRENKAYSFKDQLMARELEQELELKKKKRDTGGVQGSGGCTPVASRIPENLTKKQRELVDNELDKESAIRAKLQEVDNKFQRAYDVLTAAINISEETSYLPTNTVAFIKPLLSLLSSALASTRAQHLFVALSSVIMPTEFRAIGKQVAYATLRLYKPVYDVAENWCFCDLATNVLGVMKNLSQTFQSDPQSAPVFCYFFPFLKHVMQNDGAIVSGDMDAICSALRLMLIHVKKEAETPVLQRAWVIECMCQAIGTSLVEVQILSAKVLLAACEAASNHSSAAVSKEIEILLQSLLSPLATSRGVALKGLIIMQNCVRSLGEELSSELHVPRRVWVAMHDDDDENKTLATNLWNKLRYQLKSSVCSDILEDVGYHEPIIQKAAAASLHEALSVHTELAPLTLQLLIDIYNEKLDRPPPVFDELGRMISESPPDAYQARVGVAFALAKISPVLTEDEIEPLFTFFVPDALGDRNSEVRDQMLAAATTAVNIHGKQSTSTLLQVFEEFLKQAPSSESYDLVRQNVVILLGTLARHLDKDNPKVKPIVAKLTETLSTPSQAVQEAVANCLPALVPSIKADAPEIVKKLLVILLESNNYGERKGAAYGLAGMVKGLGIISFKQLDIMTTLTTAIQNKHNEKSREGALLAFEMFCGMLGRLFEPYIVHVLPYLLLCFGDSSNYVRVAADNTARAVMRNLSAHGVRLVLPSLLNALDSDDTWRTKTGSAELLGAMAFCAPKQLSACLPSIVPKLCEVLADSHPKVQKAGRQALKQIGSVIRNPEIQDISSVVLSALSDPSSRTSKCLQTLLDTKFVHFIDAPSLALILPVVERAFQDRSTDTRKMAAQIIGNMYSLTDEKDLKPYLPAIIPGLKNTLLDPVPEVRAIAAKALGAMVKGSGESQFEELLPWLMEKLTSEQSSVDRSGAAQGLSEVLASLGREKLSKLMPEVIKTADSDDILPHVRDGYIMLFVYLPVTFGDQFISYIGDVVKPILKALADENEYVRATALCAGQRIISTFSDTAVPVLLPQLEKGLFDDNWRIRLSSIQLLGDLLYNITGVTGKMSASGSEDENFGTSEGFQALVEQLGQERRDLVLSGLYMGRSDVAIHVRQSALHVWKIIVPNTPRILREILPTLFKLLLGCLASQNYDKRQVAAKTLGDIVRKLGERMLPELIPILELGLNSDDPSQRQGVCIGLTEIIKSCSKDAVIVFTDNLVPTVRKALCDTLPEVRAAASTTFEHLHNTIGIQALDEILPPLLRQLSNEETSEYAVDGLKQIIAVKGRVVLPFIIPKLIEPPINTRILSLFASVAGEALTRHVPTVLKALLSALIAVDETDEFSQVLEDAQNVIISVEGEHGTRIVIDDLLAGFKSADSQMRYMSIVLLHGFCKNADADFSDYVSIFMQTFIKLLADNEDRIQSEAWNALAAVTATLDPADMQKHVSSVRHALRYVKSEDVVLKTGNLPGFCLPKKGLSPLLPIFREGILNGSPDLKEQAAKGIGECIQFLTPAALKPSVVSITGPLIRILGDRFSWNVRIAVLETLSLLLEKVGVFLKPFLPQLQTTFSKAQQDPNRSVRLQAGIALSNLSSIHTRIDPLFTELNNNINNAEDISVKETSLQALRGCIKNGGKKLSEKVKTELISTLSDQLCVEEDRPRCSAAGCLGSLCAYMLEDEISQILTQHVFAKESGSSWPVRQGRSTLLAVALKESCAQVLTSQNEKKILDQVLAYASTDRVQIVIDGLHATAYLLYHYSRIRADVPTQITSAVKNGLEHSSNDMRMETCRSISWCMHHLAMPQDPQQTNGVTDTLVPGKTLTTLITSLLVLTREKNTGVRSASEYAIVSLLRLRESDAVMQKCMGTLTSRDSTSLQELHKQKLKRITETSELYDDIDNTLIKT